MSGSNAGRSMIAQDRATRSTGGGDGWPDCHGGAAYGELDSGNALGVARGTTGSAVPGVVRASRIAGGAGGAAGTVGDGTVGSAAPGVARASRIVGAPG